MKASETTFQPIIEGTKQYVVPLFQRPYSWGKKEWDVLWDDLVWLCENSEPKSHFIGSIVTMPTIAVPQGVTKYLLIDGQQRLTTIFVLLVLLRDLSKKAGEENLAEEIQQTMLVNPFKKDDDFFKLLPTQVDRDAFKALIQEEKLDEQSLLMQCYQYFERKIRQGKVDVSSLNKVITGRLSAVGIVLDLDDNPHLVFESLNAKGRTLTQSDLIRNYFFMRIHANEQEKYHAKFWTPMQNALEDSLTEFVRHYLMRNGAFVKQGDVYFTLKDRIGQGNAIDALKDLSLFAGYYTKFLHPHLEQNKELQKALTRLSRMEITTAYPFLLNCYHDFATGQISSDDFLQILKLLENYLVRRFVCNVPTSQLNKIFPLLYGQALKNSPVLVDGVRSVLQTRGYPKDNEFRARLQDAKLYGAGERAVKTKFILETLELAHAHKEIIEFAALSIEHVMPQTLTEWWMGHLGDEWQADHELYLNTIGNLTLTGYNSELSNLPYLMKREQLINSHLELNKFFSAYPAWRRANIEERSKILAELSVTIWPFFGEEDTLNVTGDDVTGKTPKFVTVLGERISVESWRDVQAQTLMKIAELVPELFVNLALEYPRFISKDPARFRRNRKLDNDYYIEVNLSAKDVYRFCIQAMEAIGLSSDDWFVETN
ncbi:MAG: DUF262 domain-containing protein [Anaerolineales bacterium]|nr:DUF262 domain-containing protein [Anaerolineales bacterium]